ncbi:MAG: phytanoyl-CoA dioxygenase family protein [Gammaproteobacteria bacterium]|nr:phytanoyl-CoA dioxygenase family protein [Gammaproteobacteria bacterium]
MRPKATFHVDLDLEQIAFFRDNGFLSIERITTDEEVEWLKEIYDRLFDQRAGEDKGLYYDLAAPRAHKGREVLPQVLGPDFTFPELRESQHYQNALKLGTQLLGTDEKVTAGGHMIFKPAEYGAETPWHQDEAYWNPDVYLNSLSVWMPLDEATVESGCMQFIPGSHKKDLRWHRHIDNDPLIHGLMTDDVDPSKAVACPLSPGGATFHHSRTLHYTAPNTTEEHRRAYILVCSGPTRKREVPAPRPWTDEEREALAKANIDVEVF